MSSIFGRAIIVPKTNKSGGALAAGDVVVIDSANDNAVTTTTTGGTTVTVGVVVEENGIANDGTGRVQFGGHVALVNVDASVTRGNYGKTHTVAKQATDAGAARIVGTFCLFTTGGTTPEADLFTQPDASSAAGSVATDAIWDAAGDSVVGTGANTAARRKNNESASVAPTVNEDSGDGYAIGSRWLDTTAGREYVCFDASVGAAVWNETTGATVSETFLTSDVNMPSANTFYDGPTVTPASGTYLIMGSITIIYGGGGSDFTAKLLAGSTILHSVMTETTIAGGSFTLAVFGYATVNGSEAIKIQAADNGTNCTIKATATTNGTTNKQTKIVLLRVA